MKTVTIHFDAGHGWLEVPTSELRDLGIERDISSYSYQQNGNAYLEEDCDASVYLNALASHGVQFSIHEVDDGVWSPIRSYRRYSHSIRARARADNDLGGSFAPADGLSY